MNASFPPVQRRAFSLVEVLTATFVLGILAFIAVPNIVRMKQDSEVNLAIARAEAINMSLASLIQANGRTAAVNAWANASDDAARYALIKPYLAFAPNAFADYMPGSYSVALPSSIATLEKVALYEPGGTTAAHRIDY